MAGRKAKFLDHVSLLDKPRAKRRRPKWLHWPHGRERMEAATKSAQAREQKLRAWAEHPEIYADRPVRANNGSNSADEYVLWKIAEMRAKEIVQIMEDNGQLDDGQFPCLDHVNVPGSDEAIAKAALTEAVKVALGPVDRKSKLAALKMVLDFTKQKPAQKVDAKINSVEDWLASVNSDDGE